MTAYYIQRTFLSLARPATLACPQEGNVLKLDSRTAQGYHHSKVQREVRIPALPVKMKNPRSGEAIIYSTRNSMIIQHCEG